MGNRYPSLTTEQTLTISQFAEYCGRYWKKSLRHHWTVAEQHPGLSDYGNAILQQLRNTHGPSWLERFRLPPREGVMASYSED